jgi:hypothetical protein
LRSPHDFPIPIFSPEENLFLDAFYNEIRAGTFGHCLTAVQALKIPTYEINKLIGYRATELICSHLPWPQPHPPSPPLPWPDLETFKRRFLPPEPNIPRYRRVELGRADFSAKEHVFYAHYLHELVSLTSGPAHEYLRSQCLSPVLMLAFQAAALYNRLQIDKVLSEPLPPFIIPWGNSAIFLTRVLYFCRERYGLKDELDRYLPKSDDAYIIKPCLYDFFLTQPEKEFLHHYQSEILHPEDPLKPATHWLWHNDVFPSTLRPFLYAAEQPSPIQKSHYSVTHINPLPPFRPAWFTKEHFEARANEALEFYPDLKNDPTAVPGYNPVDWPERKLAWLKSIPTPPDHDALSSPRKRE